MNNTRSIFLHMSGLGHMDGLSWGMMWVGWLLMVMVAGLIVWALARTTYGSAQPDRDPISAAQRILAERFARGDIDDQEYRRRSAELIG